MVFFIKYKPGQVEGIDLFKMILRINKRFGYPKKRSQDEVVMERWD